MGRKVAILWHASFTIGAGVLYFYFVLPRWPELTGDISHTTGTTLRILTGALIGLAALPVVFTLQRTRKPELATPQLALTIRTISIVAHVLAGVLIIGTAISEIWFNLDSAGQWLFASYGAAAAIALLGSFAFALSFVAELPPPPPRPIKPKKVKERRLRGKKRGTALADDADDDADDDEEADEADEVEDTDEVDEAEESDEAADAETEEAPAKVSLAKADEEATADEEVAADGEPEPVDTVEAPGPVAAAEESEKNTEKTLEAPTPRLRNRRPTGKTSHRRQRSRGGVTVEE